MAVPNDNFGLIDVINEMGGFEVMVVPENSEGSLNSAFNFANPDGFASGTPPATSALTEFAGYQHVNAPPPPPPSDPEPYALSYASNSADACTGTIPTSANYWGEPDTNFADTDVLYSTSSGLPYAAAGVYSDGFYFREWDGASFSGSAIQCPTPGPGGGDGPGFSFD